MKTPFRGDIISIWALTSSTFLWRHQHLNVATAVFNRYQVCTLGHYRLNCHILFLLLYIALILDSIDKSYSKLRFLHLKQQFCSDLFASNTCHAAPLFVTCCLWPGNSNCSRRTSRTLWHSVWIMACQRSVHFNLQISMKVDILQPFLPVSRH